MIDAFRSLFLFNNTFELLNEQNNSPRMGCTQAKIEPDTLTPDDVRIIRETWKMVGREAYGEYGQRLMLR